MKLTPKILLGVLILLFFTSLLVGLTILKSKDHNRLIIDSRQNEFTLNFQIDKKKTTEFEKFLENIDIPYQIEKGISFKLDATSSAYLNLITPITTDLDITPGKISFVGKSTRPVFIKGQTINQIHTPQGTNLAIFAPDLSGFLTSRLNLTTDAKIVFENTIKNDSGHYLLIFGPKPSFGLFFKKDDINFNNLAEIPQDAQSADNKKEDGDQVTKFYLLPSDTTNQNSNKGLFFDLGTHKVFASSIDAAKEIIQAKNTSALVFPKEEADNISFVLDFNNYENQSLSDEFVNFAFYKAIGITGGQEKVKSSLLKIKEASITLKGDTFSGLISTK